MPRFCSYCGTEMIDTAAFCPKCGRATAVQSGSPGAPPNTSTGSATQTSAPPVASPALPPNMAGTLAYLVVPAIIFLLVDPYRRDRFIRFHSFQAIFLWIVFIVINAIVGAIPLLNLFLLPLFGLAELVLWIVCVIKAWQFIIFKLPYLGDFAERQAGA